MLGIGLTRIGGDVASPKPVRQHQRGFARTVAQQPGNLLDHQQLIDHSIIMVHGGGEPDRDLVHGLEQRPSDFHVFLGKRRAARGLRLVHRIPGFGFQRRHRLNLAVKFRHQCFLIGELNGIENCCCGLHRGHQRIAPVAQIFPDVRLHQRVIIQSAECGRPVAAQIVHRLEKVRRRFRDHRYPARCGEPVPGIPGADTEQRDHTG
jgi:hypothetical protein